MKHLSLICFFSFFVYPISLFAEIVWTGANGSDIFDEANWDLSDSFVEFIDPNVSIDDDVIIKDASVEIPQVSGQQRFQVSGGNTITVDNSEIRLVGGSNDGIGGDNGSRLPQGPEGPVLDVKNGSSVEVFFIVNGVQVNIDATSEVTFGGAGNPVNLSLIDIQEGGSLAFKNETIEAFNSEHLGKVTIDGEIAEEGINYSISINDEGITEILTESDPITNEDIILSFETNENSINQGDSVNLNWSVSEDIVSLLLDDGTGSINVDFDPIDFEGGINVTLTETTTFTLTGVNNSDFEQQVIIKVTVSSGPNNGIYWVGDEGGDLFDEENWDLSNSSVEIIDPNVSIEDDVYIVDATVEIPQLPGQQRFQVASGNTITIDNSTVRLLDGSNDGFGGPQGSRLPGGSEGPTLRIINGSSYESYFIVNGVQMHVDATSNAVFGGPGNPVNISLINLEPGSTLTFLRESIEAFNSEHLSKITVGGLPAEEGINYTIESDGAEGCVITTIYDEALKITNIVRDEDGNITIDWNGKPGSFYAVDVSFNLEKDNWEELIDSVNNQAVDDTFAPEAKAIYYRVREQD